MGRETRHDHGEGIVKDYEVALAGLTENTNALRTAVILEEDWALVANHLRTIEKDLAAKRQEIEKEATWQAKATRETNPEASPLVYESDRGKLVEQIERTYSFNDSGIITAVMEATGAGFPGAIGILRGANALKLEWKISFLENVADRFGFDVPRTRKQIEDGDPDFLVGVVATSKMVRA